MERLNLFYKANQKEIHINFQVSRFYSIINIINTKIITINFEVTFHNKFTSSQPDRGVISFRCKCLMEKICAHILLTNSSTTPSFLPSPIHLLFRAISYGPRGFTLWKLRVFIMVKTQLCWIGGGDNLNYFMAFSSCKHNNGLELVKMRNNRWENIFRK